MYHNLQLINLNKQSKIQTNSMHYNLNQFSGTNTMLNIYKQSMVPDKSQLFYQSRNSRDENRLSIQSQSMNTTPNAAKGLAGGTSIMSGSGGVSSSLMMTTESIIRKRNNKFLSQNATSHNDSLHQSNLSRDKLKQIQKEFLSAHNEIQSVITKK
eukprot:403335224